MNKHTAQLLEQHFDTAFAAPDGIAKLRELILTLAMQGKLVEQDPNDPPASELLKEIEAEKQRLSSLSSSRMRGSIKPLPPIKPEEVPYELPKGWEWVRFGGIAQHNSGKTLDKGRNTGEPKDYITTSNLYWGRFELHNVRQMLIRGDELEKCTAKKNDLLICEGGEAGRAAVWHFDSEVCFQNHIHRARFYKNIDPYFAYRFFEKLNATGEISQYRKGVGISNMSGKALASIAVPFPPLLEQHRIVARIDQLMARCDELEKLRKARESQRLAVHTAAIKQLLDTPDGSVWEFIQQHFGELYTVKENVAELRKAILQLAVMGRLVPQDPNDPPASELLKEIEAEKQRLLKAGKIKKPKPLPPIKPEEVPYELPQGWEWIRFGDISLLITDGAHHTPTYIDQGVPFLSVKDMSSGTLDFSNTRFISHEQHQVLAKRCNPQKGDLLLTKVGTTGIPILVDVDVEFSIFVSVALIKFPQNLLSGKYLSWLVKAPLVKKQSEDGTEGVGNKNLVLRKIAGFLLALPPLPEQHRINDRINRLMTLCDLLDQQIDAAKAKQSELLTALLNTQPQQHTDIIDLFTYRSAIGCYAVGKLANTQYFGRTAAAKVMYLAQAHVGLTLDFHPEREAAGPLDKWIYDFERQGQSQGWFEVNEKTLASGRKKTEYRCLPALSEPAAKAEALMSVEQQTEFDRLIYALADKKTEEVEIIATLFAVWNDFLIDGIHPTDEQIIADVRENWHERKARFSPPELGRWLDWLRGKKLVPQGRPPRTVQQPRLRFD